MRYRIFENWRCIHAWFILITKAQILKIQKGRNYDKTIKLDTNLSGTISRIGQIASTVRRTNSIP